MNKKKRIPIVLLVLAVLAFIAWRIWGGAPFRYAGTVEATEVDVPARIGTLVSSYLVKEGDTVQEGQNIVDLSGEDIQLAADLADGDYRRAEPLYRSGSLSKEQFDHLRIKREDSFLKSSWRKVKAPVSGTVLTTFHEPGEWVGPGSKLLTLADLREVWVRIYIPQPMLRNVSYGQKLKAILHDEQIRSFEGKVSHINDEAEFTPKNVQTRKERERLVYAVKVTFPNPDGMLKPGMTLEVELPDK
jgi:HlyD family secretion protein